MAGYCDKCIEEKRNAAMSGLYHAGNLRVCGEHLDELYSKLENENKNLERDIHVREERVHELENMVSTIRDEAASVIHLTDSSDYLPSLWTIFRACGYDNDDLERVARAYFDKLERGNDATNGDARPMIPSLSKVLDMVREEVTRAKNVHGGFNSPHEGWAVIREEKEEFFKAIDYAIEKKLWESVKLNEKKHPERVSLFLEEAVQLAAMLVRFIMDFC